MDALSRQLQLKQRIRDGQATLGILVRTPAVQVVEVLGQSGADLVVLDAEHATFGTSELDHCILAGRSVGLPVLVRLSNPHPSNILRVLDMGAAGIVVPHVSSADAAQAAIAACRYKHGNRGFSGQHRAAGYGALEPSEYRHLSDAAIIVVAQIEDAKGLANIDEIAALQDLDAVLVGRADLAVSMDCTDRDDPRVETATRSILAAARKANMTSGIFLPEARDVGAFRDIGVSLFFIATDQSLLISAARRVADEFDQVVGVAE